MNPSAGNLHPTETYLALQDAPGLPDGLYHHRVAEHSLEQRREGPAIQSAASSLNLHRLVGILFLIFLTSVMWRESWKYRDRAYRYCLLDLGDAAVSIMIAGEAPGRDQAYFRAPPARLRQ